MNALLKRVKQNLILEHDEDDKFLRQMIKSGKAYAEKYQHKPEGFYTEHEMPETTKQAVIMLVSHLYESRDGSTGGFFQDNVQASTQVWTVVNNLLRLDRDWKV